MFKICVHDYRVITFAIIKIMMDNTKKEKKIVIGIKILSINMAMIMMMM